MKYISEQSSSPNYVFKEKHSQSIGTISSTHHPNFLNKKEIEMIEKYSKSLSINQSKTGNRKTGPELNSKRKSLNGWINFNNEHAWLYNKCFHASLDNIWGFDVTGIHDSIQYTIYEPSNTTDAFYGTHTDIGPDTWWRKISMTIQLSEPDEFEGGGLQIEHPCGELEWQNTPHYDRGDMIMFPSIRRHQALPVTKGTRKCLVIWVSGPPLR